MTKRVNWLPSLRVDVPDMTAGTSDYGAGLFKQHFDRFIIDNFARVASGFRVEIANQGTNPRQLTVYNGVAFDRFGQIVQNETQENASRTITLPANGQYFVEAYFVTDAADVDARGFWNPTTDNGTDPSGDPRLPGRELAQNVATRITPDWRLVNPVATGGFDILTNPNSLKIPVAAITVAAGVISGATVGASRSCLLRTAVLGVTKLYVADSVTFPDTGTATVDLEAVTIISNDRANGILTLTAPTTILHNIGARVAQTGAGIPQILVDRTTPAIPTSGSLDGRSFFWRGDENRGFALAQNPNSAVARGDISIQTLKDEIDFLAAQLRDIRFGAERDADLGAVPPPSSFSSPRYFERAGGVAGARYASITIGDGVTTWGDLNVNAFSNNISDCLTAAIAAIPAAGGRIYIKRGAAPYQLFTPVVLPAQVTVTGDDATEIQSTGTGTGWFVVGGGRVQFENLRLTNAGGALNPAVVKVTANSVVSMKNCYVEGFLATAGRVIGGVFENCNFTSASAIVTNNGWHGSASDTEFRSCTFDANAAAGVAARCFLLVGNNCTDVLIQNCKFTPQALQAYTVAIGPGVVGSVKNIKFDNCTFASSGAVTVAVSASSGAGPIEDLCFQNCSSTAGGGFLVGSTLQGLRITGCDITVASAVGIVTLSGTLSNIYIIDCNITATVAVLASVACIFIDTCTGITIRGCTLTNHNIGISIITGTHVTISECTITQTGTTSGRYGILGSGALTSCSITDCVIERLNDNTGPTIAGITIPKGSLGVSISACKFLQFGSLSSLSAANSYGVLCWAIGTGTVVQSLSIQGCAFRAINTTGGVLKTSVGILSLIPTFDTRIFGNEFDGIGTTGIALAPAAVLMTSASIASVTISGNTIREVGGASSISSSFITIGGTSATDISITGNTANVLNGDTNSKGIAVTAGGRRITVANNVVIPANNLCIGIWMDDSGGVQSLSEATVTGNVVGASTTNSVREGITITSDSVLGHGIVVSNNSVSGYVNSGIWLEGGTSFLSTVGVSGNTLASTIGSVSFVAGISVTGALVATVVGNSIQQDTAGVQICTCIRVTSCASVTIASNVAKAANQAATTGVILVDGVTPSYTAITGNTVVSVAPTAGWWGIAVPGPGADTGYVVGNVVRRIGGGVGSPLNLSGNIVSVGLLNGGNDGTAIPIGLPSVGLNWLST